MQVACYDDGVGTSSFKPLALLGGAIGAGLVALLGLAGDYVQRDILSLADDGRIVIRVESEYPHGGVARIVASAGPGSSAIPTTSKSGSPLSNCASHSRTSG